MSHLYVELLLQVVALGDPRDLGLDAFVGSESTSFQLHKQLYLAWRGDDVFQFHGLELFHVHHLAAC